MIIDSFHFNSKNFVLYIIISIQPSPIKLYPPPPPAVFLIQGTWFYKPTIDTQKAYKEAAKKINGNILESKGGL